MTDLQFRKYQSSDFEVLQNFVFQLYVEDVGENEMHSAKIKKTVKMLSQKPDLGEICMIEQASKVVGYALLINYWSNEYGGLIVNIDELFIAANYRNQGIATQFIAYLIQRNEQEVAFELEVNPENKNAYRLYQRLGFTPYASKHLIYEK
jgi:ribosomal protein S18 acetylase RimI-like enzyme